MPEPEPLLTGDEQHRVFEPRLAAPRGPDPLPDVERATLRHAFERPAAGQVEDLRGVRRHGEGHLQAADAVRRPGVVGDPGPLPYEATGGEDLDLDVGGEPVLRVVRRAAQHRAAVGLAVEVVRRVPELRRPAAAVAVADEPRAPEPALRQLGEHRDGLRIGDRAVADGRERGQAQVRQGVVSQRAEVRSPVQDAREPSAVDGDDEAGASRAQVYRYVVRGVVHFMIFTHLFRHPLSPLLAMPAKNCRCRSRKTITSGMEHTNAPAMRVG
ncbi:hypothetical protein GCM10018952_08140 [Streptosporangium vulgare]